MFPSYLEVQISGFQLFRACSQLLGARKKITNTVAAISSLFGERKKWIPAIWRPKNDYKIQFTTVRSKEKDYDIYLKSEKLVHSQQEHEKNVSQLFGSGKTGSQLFRA